jgi:hypothetical protein
MCKVAYQPFTVLVRAEPSDSPWISTSAKVLRASATFATAIALFGAVAICSNGFGAFAPRSFGSKALADLPISPATNATTPADRENAIGRLPLDTNQGRQGAITSDHSTFDQTPGHALASIPPSASMARPGAPVNDGASLNREHSDTARKILERPLSNAARKSLENLRRQAVRKRSRLAEMYQKQAISREAYEKGKEKYRSEIERYRRETRTGK